MNKVLKISKHKLDLARVELTASSLLIGRSPLCDQVLRAPGIMPVHFLLEWIGEGEFNPNEGMWTLFDMGHLVSRIDENLNAADWNNKDQASEGIIIDENQQYFGLNWSITEDRLGATHIQRGIISSQLKASVKGDNTEILKKMVLEVVCLNQEEQRVQNIWHFFDQRIDYSRQLEIDSFKLKWNSADSAIIDFLEKPISVFNLKGQRIGIDQTLHVSPQETFIIHYKEEMYFVRFISRVEYQPSKFNIFKNKFWIFNLFFIIFFSSFLWKINNLQSSLPEVRPNLSSRVIKIVEPEVVVEEKIIPSQPPAPLLDQIVNPPAAVPKKLELKKEKTLVSKIEVPKIAMPNKKKDSASAAPAFKSDPGKERSGLNSPAKYSDVNAVGLLGKMKNRGDSGKSKQVSAETITQTFANDTASAKDNKGILIATSQSGVVGTPNNASGGVSNNDNNLIGAQTTLRGAKDFDSTNSGPIARSKGLKGVFTSGNGSGSALNGGSASTGHDASNGISSGAGNVVGGLTKAQVFSVISAHRREIRTCFETALSIRNDINGILRLSFVINVAGSVVEINVVNSEIESGVLESCVIQVIRKMVFPQAPNNLSTTVIYPFVFKRSL